MANHELALRIDAVLPQTQCTRCGFAGCRPYADAMAAGTADINRCPPGGDPVIAALAALTGRAPRPLDPACGTYEPLQVAVIDEAACIGCTLCIDACPVDAILGAQKRMHAILPSLCSGCELCVPPCPVDCIDDGARRPGVDTRRCGRGTAPPRGSVPYASRGANASRSGGPQPKRRARNGNGQSPPRSRGHGRAAARRRVALMRGMARALAVAFAGAR